MVFFLYNKAHRNESCLSYIIEAKSSFCLLHNKVHRKQCCLSHFIFIELKIVFHIKYTEIQVVFHLFLKQIQDYCLSYN